MTRISARLQFEFGLKVSLLFLCAGWLQSCKLKNPSAAPKLGVLASLQSGKQVYLHGTSNPITFGYEYEGKSPKILKYYGPTTESFRDWVKGLSQENREVFLFWFLDELLNQKGERGGIWKNKDGKALKSEDGVKLQLNREKFPKKFNANKAKLKEMEDDFEFFLKKSNGSPFTYLTEDFRTKIFNRYPFKMNYRKLREANPEEKKVQDYYDAIEKVELKRVNDRARIRWEQTSGNVPFEPITELDAGTQMWARDSAKKKAGVGVTKDIIPDGFEFNELTLVHGEETSFFAALKAEGRGWEVNSTPTDNFLGFKQMLSSFAEKFGENNSRPFASQHKRMAFTANEQHYSKEYLERLARLARDAQASLVLDMVEKGDVFEMSDDLKTLPDYTYQRWAEAQFDLFEASKLEDDPDLRTRMRQTSTGRGVLRLESGKIPYESGAGSMSMEFRGGLGTHEEVQDTFGRILNRLSQGNLEDIAPLSAVGVKGNFEAYSTEKMGHGLVAHKIQATEIAERLGLDVKTVKGALANLEDLTTDKNLRNFPALWNWEAVTSDRQQLELIHAQSKAWIEKAAEFHVAENEAGVRELFQSASKEWVLNSKVQSIVKACLGPLR